jgi:hypothetical protein
MDTVRPITDDVIPPDSRLRDRSRHIVRGLFPLLGVKINWIRIFCANCGKWHGYVPEENCDFVCWLCDDCADRWGTELATMLIPDQVFWQKVRYEQLERYGRLLSASELQVAAESTCTPLGKLLRDRR